MLLREAADESTYIQTNGGRSVGRSVGPIMCGPPTQNSLWKSESVGDVPFADDIQEDVEILALQQQLRYNPRKAAKWK